MADLPYKLIENLVDLVDVQEDSITSRSIFDDAMVKGVLFAFDAGQTLSEHTATIPAIIHVLSGETTITLGEDGHELSSGAWMHMSANLKHSVYAKTKMKMLLLMLKSG